MKQILIFIFCTTALFAAGQDLPQAIQQVLDQKTTEMSDGLKNYRTDRIERVRLRHNLRDCFPMDLRKEADIYNLNVGMIYDDEARNRIVQLLQNEYRKDELDTLLNRFLQRELKWTKREALAICRYDTMQIYKDSLAVYFERVKKAKQGKNESFGYDHFYKYDVMDILRFDTTVAYKRVFDSLFQKRRDEEIVDIKNRWLFCLECIVEVCGYIKDKRFIAPLEDIYKNSTDEKIKNAAELSLLQMRVEPYFSAYLKRMTLPLEVVKSNQHTKIFINRIELPYQEIYLEISKYLFSNDCYVKYPLGDDPPDRAPDYCAFQLAYETIRENILNKELQKIMSAQSTLPFEIEKSKDIRQKVYDWMQKNYGKYEIRRIW